MKFSVSDRLLSRELAGSPRLSSIKAIYGDQKWVEDLDIVNELEGHDGCVNALSWSKTGNLLASGSDDQRLNIHRFQPEDSTKSFSLATTIQTGHSANIFSVKFMPHSNDQLLVSAAGDGQVRIFDIEHSGRSSVPTAGNLPQADRLQGLLHNGTRFLSASDTSAKVYRSHGDRVKRIVTESSPHLFLTCSEDGEVRQWDLRQPSSAYPRPRESSSGDSGVPPPLISYKRYQIDLNTISCSPSQPHYIALGGAHLHTFLHDRRMIGRSKHLERGQPDSSTIRNDHDENLMGEATKCVRRFAPNGHRRMKRSGNGHITACKISDAHPNEMIASWSGDHIYSFDLIRSPDAGDQPEDAQAAGNGGQQPNVRAQHSRDRKRKRTKEGSELSQEGTGRATSGPRASGSATATGEPPAQSLRVKYENGQSEEIPIRESEEPSESLVEATEAAMSDAEKRSYRIANTSVKIRKSIFSLENPKQPSDTDPTGFASSFTSALGFCSSILEDMDEVISTWRFPVDPDEVEVVFQTTLKRNRESARRFVQAAGMISRLLGGKLRTAGGAEHPMLSHFAKIVPAPNEARIMDEAERFRYDFIKAIALWLDSGPGAVVEGFSRQRPNTRFPLPGDAGVEAIDDILIPHLLRMASDDPVPDVDASRFELDEHRKVFGSEKAAVLAFASAIKIPFEDLSSAIIPASSEVAGSSVVDRVAAQDRKTALKFWGLKVARGLLLLAGEGVNHTFVDRAFGGLGGPPSARVREDERLLNERLNDIDPEIEEPIVDSVAIAVNGDGASEISDEEMIPAEEVRAAVDEFMTVAADNESEHEDDGDEDEDQIIEASGSDLGESESEDDDDDDDDDEEAAAQSFLFRSGQSLRTQVNLDVPCSSHTRTYIGHCNVKTVKDVNFYGLNDEYVVSGSDSGHLFIWDRHSAKLLNILEGDGEVVNVVQGHPYEPVLAVSGIDHTVKVFSADARARHDARHGIGVSNVDTSGFSSLRYGSRTRFGQARRPPRTPPQRSHSTQTKEPGDGVDDESTKQRNSDGALRVTSEAAVPRTMVDDLSSDDESFDQPPRPVSNGGLSSRRRMHDSYAILAQNDHDRRGGQREAFITRSMLAQLAARMRVQLRGGTGGNTGGAGDAGGETGNGNTGGANEGEEDDGLTLHFEGGGSIVLRDDCEVM